MAPVAFACAFMAHGPFKAGKLHTSFSCPQLHLLFHGHGMVAWPSKNMGFPGGGPWCHILHWNPFWSMLLDHGLPHSWQWPAVWSFQSQTQDWQFLVLQWHDRRGSGGRCWYFLGSFWYTWLCFFFMVLAVVLSLGPAFMALLALLALLAFMAFMALLAFITFIAFMAFMDFMVLELFMAVLGAMMDAGSNGSQAGNFGQLENGYQ